MKRLKILALSGFLGDESDWNFLKENLPHHYDLESYCPTPLAHESLPQWADRFHREHASNDRALLLGYSLGGRVAMHVLTQYPESYLGLIAISAHPGLSSASEKAARIESDLNWAKRFRSNESWDELLQAWNAQPVFTQVENLKIPPRKPIETPALRSRCVSQLLNFSLGLQTDLRDAIIETKLPQIWLTGSLDTKFSKLAQEFSRRVSPTVRWISVDGAGHRWPWELPAQQAALILTQLIGDFYEN